MKTTIAKLCNYKFKNDNANVIGFSSSLPAIKEFISDENLKDTVAIIDDAHACSTTKEKRTQNIKLSEIVRFVANNTEEIKKIGNENIKYSNKCTVTITGEQMQDVASILSRCIIVLHNIAPSKIDIGRLQKNHQYINVFICDFLKWVSENFDKLVKLIQSEFLRLRERRQYSVYNNERISDNYSILSIAYTIFFEYGEQKKFIDINSKRKFLKDISNTLTFVKKRQLKFIEKYSTDIEYDFFKAIKTLFNQDKLNLKKKAKKPFDNFDGTIKNNNVFLKKDNLLILMRDYFNNNKILEIDIVTQLKNLGVLKIYKDNGSTKKIDGVRMLCIPIYNLL